MAPQQWRVYNLAKRKIGAATINLASAAFRCSLYQSSSNFATLTLGVIGSVTNEVAEANGYSSSGKALSNRTWTVGASAGQYRFDADDITWTATGGAIANIKGAVIWASGASAGARHLLCRASLTSSQFTLSSGNTMTVTMNSSGIFTMA